MQHEDRMKVENIKEKELHVLNETCSPMGHHLWLTSITYQGQNHTHQGWGGASFYVLGVKN